MPPVKQNYEGESEINQNGWLAIPTLKPTFTFLVGIFPSSNTYNFLVGPVKKAPCRIPIERSDEISTFFQVPKQVWLESILSVLYISNPGQREGETFHHQVSISVVTIIIIKITRKTMHLQWEIFLGEHEAAKQTRYCCVQRRRWIISLFLKKNTKRTNFSLLHIMILIICTLTLRWP